MMCACAVKGVNRKLYASCLMNVRAMVIKFRPHERGCRSAGTVHGSAGTTMRHSSQPPVHPKDLSTRYPGIMYLYTASKNHSDTVNTMVMIVKRSPFCPAPPVTASEAHRPSWLQLRLVLFCSLLNFYPSMQRTTDSIISLLADRHLTDMHSMPIMLVSV